MSRKANTKETVFFFDKTKQKKELNLKNSPFDFEDFKPSVKHCL